MTWNQHLSSQCSVGSHARQSKPRSRVERNVWKRASDDELLGERRNVRPLQATVSSGQLQHHSRGCWLSASIISPMSTLVVVSSTSGSWARVAFALDLRCSMLATITTLFDQDMATLTLTTMEPRDFSRKIKTTATHVDLYPNRGRRKLSATGFGNRSGRAQASTCQ